MPEIYTRARNVFVIQFNLSNVNAPRLSLCSDPGFICGNLQGNSSYAASGYYCTLFGRLLARAGGHHRAADEPGGALLLAAGMASVAAAARARKTGGADRR